MWLSYVGLQNCRHASLKVRLQTNALVRGVAYLDDKYYIVCTNSDTISVFHVMPPHEQLRGIYVSGLREPTDIVACAINGILYVSDWSTGCVWQVTTGGKVDWRLPAWSPTRRKADAVSPVSLSVRSGRLVVVESGKILICNAHDDRVDEIKFPESVTLRHAAETEHHSLLVALTDSRADKSHSTICEMKQDHQDHNEEWIVSRELDLRSVTPHTHISQPRYITWDSHGYFYVATDNSRKVLVLDNELKMVRSVHLRKRSMPHRMCFLSQQDILLLVVDAGFSVNAYGEIMPLHQIHKK